MTKRLEELEDRRASLQAEVNIFRTQQACKGIVKRVLLPQIEEVDLPSLSEITTWFNGPDLL